MLIFRFVCALLMAWAVNWALSRPEGQAMIQNLPDELQPKIQNLSLIAAGAIGYFNLAVRQGWGFIVAFANGIWAGILTILATGVLMIIAVSADAMETNTVKDFDNFMRLFGDTIQPLLDAATDVPLLVVSLGATAIVGAITEVIHWLLVRVRTKRTDGAPKTGP